MVGWWVGWFCYLVGCLVGWSVGWLVGWLVGCYKPWLPQAGPDNASGLPQDVCTTAPSTEAPHLLPARMDPLLHSHPTVAHVYIAIMAAALLVCFVCFIA